MHIDAAGMHRIRAHKVENSVSIAGASSLLASFKPGGRHGWKRARENRSAKTMPLLARDVGERAFSTGAAETGRHKRYWLWLDIAMTGLWVVLLLSIVAYAVVEGEAALAQLDELDLVATYSTSP
jgi:hypothetical protein